MLDTLFHIAQTPLNNFEKKAKEIIEGYYLQPYPKHPTKNHWQPCPSKDNLKDGYIERVYHGGMHVSRVADYVDHFHNLYTQYKPNTLNNLESLADSVGTDQNTLLMLTKYAALFHDSGRQDEDVDYWDKQSAENCRRYLRDNGVPEQLLQLVGAAAQYKGEPGKFSKCVQAINNQFNLNISVQKADYIRQLICNSDTLDVMRVRTNFDLKYLDIYQSLGHLPKARMAIINTCKMAGEVIYKQGDACMKCDIYENGHYVCPAIKNSNLSMSKKLTYEHADNTYQMVRHDLLQKGFMPLATVLDNNGTKKTDSVQNDFLLALHLQSIENAKFAKMHKNYKEKQIKGPCKLNKRNN